MDTFIPLISSGVDGPLGVLHLPRFWLKASLEARGKLDKRYPGCGKGYDQMTLNNLGVMRPWIICEPRDPRTRNSRLGYRSNLA